MTPTIIARKWRGVVRREDADAYLTLLKRTGLADYRQTPGNLGVVVERSLEGPHAVFVITFWESEQAIRKFGSGSF
jgi:heme-degrading monooxygenase HmoA